VETFTGKQPLTAGAVDAMHEVLDLESYIYNLEPDSEDVERFGYEHGKACKIHKLWGEKPMICRETANWEKSLFLLGETLYNFVEKHRQEHVSCI
jgi:hypothetical protein